MSLPVLPAAGFEDHVRSLGRAVVVFTADWCPFCRRFEAVFEQASARHAGSAFAVADISDDDTDPRWDAYDIRVVPTVIAFEEGAPRERLDGTLGRGISGQELDAALTRWRTQARLP